MMMLGGHFTKSDLVKQDLVRAYLWYDVAAQTFTPSTQRYEAASRRDATATKMSSAQRQQAAQLSSAWAAVF